MTTDALVHLFFRERLRLRLVELQVAPLRHALRLSREEFFGMLMHGKTLDDFPHLAQTADAMLDDLIGWAKALRAGRSKGG